MQVRELIEAAFLAGYREGVTAYAWWKNGEQMVGTCGHRLAPALRAAEENAKPAFDLFLEKQRGRSEENG